VPNFSSSCLNAFTFPAIRLIYFHKKGGDITDIDKLELLSEQFLAIGEIWEMLLILPYDREKRKRAEELLLELIKSKQKELHEAL